jgi:hypothetical protein
VRLAVVYKGLWIPGLKLWDVYSISTAGAIAGLATAQLQPIIVYHLPNAFFFKTDGIMKFDFNQSPHSTVPVNLHFGRGFTNIWCYRGSSRESLLEAE